jgi:ketosteroid isomerase-like protein
VSEENVQVVEAGTDAYNAGDLHAVMECYTPDVEAYPDAGFPEASPLVGRDEFRRWLEGIREPWAVARWVVHETRAIEPDRVLQRGDFGGVGMGSSIETLASYTLVYTMRDSLIARVDYFSDHAAALAAVGLKE